MACVVELRRRRKMASPEAAFFIARRTEGPNPLNARTGGLQVEFHVNFTRKVEFHDPKTLTLTDSHLRRD
jgi:hypothetical protein